MKITTALRKRLEPFLPTDYRQEVVKRLNARGISVHPNTVSNVLNGSENIEVAKEILRLVREQKSSHKEFNALAKQI